MTASQKYPGEAVELPLDDWLYEARPRQGCARCAEALAELHAAKKSKNASARFEAARKIRLCPHGATP
ncbi:hypothetical protein AB0D57_40865 [Streptomyces sp. NPDC048275]|uniref:hypothetical protein n=1 Tax=Streptomyces sp. NPDC048275 TaxID=3155629 RepID=UPI0033C9284A